MEAFWCVVGTFFGLLVCVVVVIGIILMFSSGIAKVATRNIVKIVEAIKHKAKEGGDDK